MEKPVKKGEVLEITIIDVAEKGIAIGRIGNFVIMTKGATPNDVVKVQISRIKKNFADAKLLEIISRGEYYRTPICSHFADCGGCSRQDIDYQKQLEIKENFVRKSVLQHCNPNTQILPIVGSPKKFYYRNKMDFGASPKRWLTYAEVKSSQNLNAAPALGFHVSGKYDKILDIDRCYLQPEPANSIRNNIKHLLIDNNVSFFDTVSKQGVFRNLIIKSNKKGEVMVIFICFEDVFKEIEHLLNKIQNKFPSIVSLYFVFNPKGNDTTFDLDHKLIYGSEFLEETINGIRYLIGPKSFFQTNPHGAELLFNKAIELANISKDSIIYDLYCGVGTIGLQFSNFAKHIVGIEEIPEAIEMAKKNAKLNLVDNAHYYIGDVKAIFNQDIINIHGKPNVIITDPPRVGMSTEVVNTLNNSGCPKIIYISCNPATQARDLELLNKNYEVKYIQPVDMFPHTYHIESIAILELKN